jgi:hypothetical protein
MSPGTTVPPIPPGRQLDQHGFQEAPLRRLEPQAGYPNGLHSFCPAGEVTIIDGKKWDLQLLDIARKPLTKLLRQCRLLRRAALPRSLVLPHRPELMISPPVTHKQTE